MRATLFLGLFVVVAFAPAFAPAQPATAAAAAGDPLPTMKELREQFRQGKHPDVLRHIQRALQLKGDAAKGYNRYELLCLRGETLLRTKSMPEAADAFDEAAEVARDDSNREGVARGTAVLIRRSKPIGYVPRPAKSETGKPAPPPRPMPIVEEADRKAALAALLADERAVVEPKLRAAQRATSLPLVIEVSKMLGDLWAVEVAATGKGEEAKSTSAELAGRAHELIAAALDSMNDGVEKAWRDAGRETWIHYKDTGHKVFKGRVGLHGASRNAVVFALEQTKLLAPAAAALARVTDDDALRRDATVARKLHNRAAYLLEFNYQSLKQDRRPVAPAPRAG